MKSLIYILISAISLLTINSFASSENSKRKPFDPFNDQVPSNQKAIDQNDGASTDEVQSDDFDNAPSTSMADMFFGNAFKTLGSMMGGVGNIQTSQREDKDYKYIDIAADGIDKNNLDISIKDSQISIQGQIKQEKKENGVVTSTFSSSFMKSFPVPDGVDATNPQFDTTEGKISIKFKKK